MQQATLAVTFAALLLAAPSAFAARHLQQIQAQLISTQILPSYASIPDFAADQSDFSTFELVLNVTGMMDSVSDPDVAVTILAPTNAAFDEFLAAQNLSLDDMLDSDYLVPIIMYHIVPDVVSTNQMNIGQTLPTLLPEANLTVAAAPIPDTLFKIQSDNPDSSADIISNMNNIMAGQSLVQAVNHVLLPPMPVLEAVVMGTDNVA